MINKKVFFSYLIIQFFLIPLVCESLVSPYKTGEKYGLVNDEMKIIEDAVFSSYLETENFYVMKKSSNFVCFDKTGNKINLIKAISIKAAGKNLIEVFGFDDTYYFDLTANKAIKEIIPDDIYVVSKNINSFDLVDSNGRIIKGKLYECGRRYSEGLIPAKDSDGKTGFLDRNGNFVFECPIYEKHESDNPKIEPIYNFEFANGFVCVPDRPDSFSIYDKNGNLIATKKNCKIEQNRFTNGFILVSKFENQKKQYFYLNTKGKNIFNEFFDYAEPFAGNFASITNNGKDALIDSSGKIYYCEKLTDSR